METNSLDHEAEGKDLKMHIAQHLRAHGISPITHRTAVYQYLLEHPTHPSAETIYQDLSKVLSSLSRTTVFNVLKLLCDRGIVRRISVEHDKSVYDANVEDHIHFKCLQCGKIIDLFDIPYPKLQLPKGYTLKEVQINAWGICPACGAQNSNS